MAADAAAADCSASMASVTAEAVTACSGSCCSPAYAAAANQTVNVLRHISSGGSPLRQTFVCRRAGSAQRSIAPVNRDLHSPYPPPKIQYGLTLLYISPNRSEYFIFLSVGFSFMTISTFICNYKAVPPGSRLTLHSLHTSWYPPAVAGSVPYNRTRLRFRRHEPPRYTVFR